MIQIHIITFALRGMNDRKLIKRAPRIPNQAKMMLSISATSKTVDGGFLTRSPTMRN